MFKRFVVVLFLLVTMRIAYAALSQLPGDVVLRSNYNLEWTRQVTYLPDGGFLLV